jgi:cysteine-rich repeat protein
MQICALPVTALLLARCGSPDTGTTANAITGGDGTADSQLDGSSESTVDARADSGGAIADAKSNGATDGGSDVRNDVAIGQNLADGPSPADAGPLAVDAAPGCAPVDAGSAPDGAAVCGDGWRDPKKEECDDGLKTSATRRGCSAQCQVLDELAVAPPADAGIPTAARTLGTGHHPLAASDSTFAAAYLEADTTPPVLSLATFSSKAVPAGPVTPFSAHSTVVVGSNPVLAGLPCNTYVAAWSDYGGDGDELGVAVQLVQPGVPVTGPPLFANTTTMFSQFDPDIVWTGSEIVVAWVDDSNEATQPDLRFRVFDATTNALSGEQTLAATSDSEADVALAPFAGGWAAAWRDDANGLETIRVHTGTTDWTVGPAFLSAPVAPKPALVQLDATHLLVAYAVGIAPLAEGGAADAGQDATVADAGVLPALTSKIQVAVLDVAAPATPHVLDVPPTVKSAIGLSQSQPTLASAGGSLFLAWWTEAALGDPNGEELWLKPIAWNGQTLSTTTPEVPLPRWPQARVGDQRNPALAASALPPSGALVLGWDDLGSGISGIGRAEAAEDVVVELIPVPMLRTAGDGGP